MQPYIEAHLSKKEHTFKNDTSFRDGGTKALSVGRGGQPGGRGGGRGNSHNRVEKKSFRLLEK